jgi:hypothetical protein
VRHRWDSVTSSNIKISSQSRRNRGLIEEDTHEPSDDQKNITMFPLPPPQWTMLNSRSYEHFYFTVVSHLLHKQSANIYWNTTTKVTIGKLRSEDSEKDKCADTLILDLLTTASWVNKFLLFKPPSLEYFIGVWLEN